MKESSRDWIDDFKHENGNYFNECIKCHSSFIGHKRRVVCKECSDKEVSNKKSS